jgi:IS605 OrfB family transposase
MITIKLPIEPIDITNYLHQYNCVVRFAYNRFQEELKQSEVEQQVKSRMNNIDLMDASLIKSACDSAKGLTEEKVIFGGKKNWQDYNKGLKTKEEYKSKQLKPLIVRGSRLDNNGNRKFQLDIIGNNQVIFKPAKGIKIFCKLPKTKYVNQLCLLQKLCEAKEQPFTCAVNNTHIFITFDETILRTEKYNPINRRILAIDSNPNYIAFVVICKNEILHKEIIGLKDLNKAKTNKKKHEDFEISKRIVDIAKHYRVAHIVHEQLTIRSSNKGKGKAFNKACNNNWRRTRFFKNLKKRCNIIGIHVQEVIAQYSSFLGQIDYPNEYDSVAAALEIARRGIVFLKKFFYGDDGDIKGKIVRIQEDLPVDLADRWKKKLNSTGNFKTYKSLYEAIKKSKYSYRFLFQHDWFSLRMKSTKSLTFVHH